jgi:hypothetical protein
MDHIYAWALFVKVNWMNALYDLLWGLDLRKTLSKFVGWSCVKLYMISSFVNQICKFKSFERRLIHFEIQGNFERNYSICLINFVVFFFFQMLVFSCGGSYLFRPQLIFYFTTRLQATTHGCSLPLWMWSTSTRDSLHHTIFLNMMLDPSICWRIDCSPQQDAWSKYLLQNRPVN